MKYLNKSVLEIHELLKEKKIKPIDLVEEAFENIENNKELNEEDIILNNTYTPITICIYFLFLFWGKIISIIVATITASTICSAHKLIKFIICTSSHYLIFLQPL